MAGKRGPSSVVFAAERIFGEEIYMVGDGHDVAYLELFVHVLRRRC